VLQCNYSNLKERDLARISLSEFLAAVSRQFFGGALRRFDSPSGKSRDIVGEAAFPSISRSKPVRHS
jgi:hypothetical protein